MELTGWGRYPTIDSDVIKPLSKDDVIKNITGSSGGELIARGLGRSYGDSSLAPQVLNTLYMDHFLNFDESEGLLTCSAGASLADILGVFVPKGWFLPVTPGTKFVTVGGAIASDVHGKNHHLEGCFSDHVSSLKIATASGSIVECSREINPNFFHATCGGMGLTGVIVEATFRLRPVKSAFIEETTIKARNLEEVQNLFDLYRETTYSVAWIDCLSTGRSLGRSLLMLGEHAGQGELVTSNRRRLTVPVDMPGCLLNYYSIQAFNALYYNRVRKGQSERIIHYEPFFYPLDGIHNWNRLYGKNGFFY